MRSAPTPETTVVPARVILGKSVHVGANVLFITDDHGKPVPGAIVGDGVYIGAGAIIYPEVHIAAGARIMPGTVVKRSIPAAAIVEGHPAIIVGYVGADISVSPHFKPERRMAPVEQTPVKGVAVYNFPVISDLRGNLTVGEFETQIPFKPLRYFMVYGVPNREIRGEHAHHKCHQFLICVRGQCSVVVDDGISRAEIVLDTVEKGVHIPPMIWGVQYKYTSDALLMVFASHHYAADDYIRDYQHFIEFVKSA